MPTYTCRYRNLDLDTKKKARIAAAITQTHREVTGAPTFFVQVIFDELVENSHFIGAVADAEPHIFVGGDIRGGRSDADLHRLVTLLVTRVATASGAGERATWVYLAKLAPRHMAEFGHVLPEPGGEAAWLARLPTDERRWMEGSGVPADFRL